MYDRKIRPGEFTTLDEALGPQSDDVRNYKFAFFSESSEFFESVKETRATLVNDAFDLLMYIICLISILSFALFLFLMRRTVANMTGQVIYFFETMEDILEVDTKKQKVDLTYKASCKELNELQIEFNHFVKTINITNKTVKEGEEYLALLDYADAYYSFKGYKNER